MTTGPALRSVGLNLREKTESGRCNIRNNNKAHERWSLWKHKEDYKRNVKENGFQMWQIISHYFKTLTSGSQWLLGVNQGVLTGTQLAASELNANISNIHGFFTRSLKRSGITQEEVSILNSLSRLLYRAVHAFWNSCTKHVTKASELRRCITTWHQYVVLRALSGRWGLVKLHQPRLHEVSIRWCISLSAAKGVSTVFDVLKLNRCKDQVLESNRLRRFDQKTLLIYS